MVLDWEKFAYCRPSRDFVIADTKYRRVCLESIRSAQSLTKFYYAYVERRSANPTEETKTREACETSYEGSKEGGRKVKTVGGHKRGFFFFFFEWLANTVVVKKKWKMESLC